MAGDGAPEDREKAAEESAAETPGERAAETPEQRRRRLEAVFGDVLPEGTRDDRDEPGSPERGNPDRWLRDQVPPHHGS